MAQTDWSYEVPGPTRCLALRGNGGVVSTCLQEGHDLGPMLGVASLEGE